MLKMYDFWNTLRLMRRMRKKEVVKFSLATALVATTMLPSAAWAAAGENFYGNQRLGDNNLLSGVKVTLSTNETKAEATGKETKTVSGTPNWGKVYGVYASEGQNLTASNNSVYMSAGEVAEVAGCSFFGNNCTGQSNTVTITGSSKVTGNVYGGSAAVAQSNTVTITGSSTVGGSVYGGSASAAQSNTVTITGSTVTGNVYGSTSGTSGEMLSNTATITNSTVSGYVYGGYNDSDSDNIYAAKYNTATITGSTVTIENAADKSSVAGCLNYGSGDVVNNTLTITGSTVTIGSETQKNKALNIGVYGSYKNTNYAGTAEGNTVTINEKSTVTLIGKRFVGVYGNKGGGTAKSNAVKITDSTVNIKGTINGSSANSGIYGSYGDNSTTAEGNTVTITNSTVGITAKNTAGIYGGCGGTVTGNTVTIDGGSKVTITTLEGGSNCGIYGGYGSTVTGNTVSIEGGSTVVSSDVYGGYNSSSGAVTGNTVSIKSGSTVSGNVYGGYNSSSSGTATGNKVAIAANNTDGVPTLTSANFYGSNKAATGATGKDANTLDLSGVTTALTVKSISNFDAITMGTGALTVTATSDLTNTTIDAKYLTDVSSNKDYTFIQAEDEAELLTVTNATLSLSEAAENYRTYLVNTATDGVSQYKYEKVVDAKKVGIEFTQQKQDAGIYIVSDSEKYSKDHLDGKATSGTLTIDGTLDTTGKIYAGAYAEGEQTATGGTVAISSSANVTGDLYAGYSASGKVESNTMTVAAGATLASANLYGSNSAATGTNNNKLDLSGVTTALTVKSISNFDAITMGTGVVTVTAASNLTNTAIDATAITSLTEDEKTDGRTLLEASGDGVKFTTNKSTTVKVSDALKEYIVDTTAGVTNGVVTQGYKGNVTATKISIVKGDVGTKVAGLYIDSTGKGYNAEDLTSGTAKSGTLTISGDVTTISKSYYGAYAEGEQTATGGTLEVKTGGKVTVNVYGGYSTSGAVTSNTVTFEGGEVSSSVYGGYSTSGAATSNTVTITDGTVNGNVRGGYSTSGAVTGNTVTITGGEVGSDVRGGYNAGSGEVTGNTVTITGGKVGSDVYGGYSFSGTATGNTVTLKGGTIGSSENAANVYGGYSDSDSGTATGNTVKIVATSTQAPDLTNANLYGSNKAATGATGDTANKLDISGVAVDLTAKSISNFDAITMGTGKVTVTAVSDLTNTTIDAKYLTDVSSNKDYTFIQAKDEGELLTVTNATLSISEAAENYRTYLVNTATDGVSQYKYEKVVDAKKVGIEFTQQKQDAGIYIVSNSEKYSKGHLDGKATSGTLTVNDTLDTTGKIYAGAYAQGDATATGGTVAIGSSANVTGDLYAGYSVSGKVENNTMTVADGATLTNAKLYGSNKDVTAQAEEGKENVLDLTAVSSATSIASIDSFDLVKMGSGTITVTANSSFANASIDATNITKITGTGCDLIVASGSGVSLDVTNTTVKLNDSLKAPYEADATSGISGGIYKVGYEGKATAEKISIAKTAGTNIAGLYIASDGKGYNKDDLTGGEAKSGELTISGELNTKGKIYAGVYAESSQTATGGTLTINNDANVIGNTYAGYSESGSVTGNTANITGGEVGAYVYGGYSKSGEVTSNTVTITGGTFSRTVYGGYNATSGAAERNKVTVEGTNTKVTSSIMGASARNDAKSNAVAIASGAYVDGDVYGGFSTSGAAESNMVTVEGDGTQVTGEVYGGIVEGNAKSNEVAITSGASVGSDVYGGYSYGTNGTAESNKVTVEGSSTQVTGKVYGGNAKGNANSNEVAIASGASVAGYVYGGYSTSGVANENTVSVTGVGTEVSGQVYGGYTEGTGATADKNIVTISAGSKVTGSNVFGGRSKAGTAESNKVIIEGSGTEVDGGESGTVYGASASSDAKSNVVTIKSGATVKNYVQGGFSSGGSTNENTVTITDAGTNVTKDVYGGQTKGTDATANKNIVTISAGSMVSGKVYGGNSKSGTAESNKVTVEETDTKVTGKIYGAYASSDAKSNEVAITSGASVGDYVYGGYSAKNAAESNKVTVEETDTKVTGKIYGAYASSDAKSNVVAIASGATVDGDVQGGYSDSGTAESNKVTVEGTDTKVTGYIIGAYASSDAKSNEVAIASGASVSSNVYGGNSDSGTAESNKVTVEGDGTQVTGDVYGGYACGSVKNNVATIKSGASVGSTVYGGFSDSGTAESNKVTVEGTDTKVTGYIIGAYAFSDAKSNVVAITSGASVSVDVYGGFSYYGTAAAESNKVTVEGTNTKVTGDIYGAYASSDAKSNVVAIASGATVDGDVQGGYSDSGTAESNKVTVEETDTKVTGKIYGAYASSDAKSNVVVIASGATVDGDVQGGYSDSGTAESNKVTVEGDGTQVTGEVYGGSGKTGATGNSVNITGGTVGSSEKTATVYGGYSKAGSANENTVTITGAGTKVTGEVYGGEAEGTAATANENAVTIDQDGEIVGNVYGGYSASGVVNKNTATITDGTVSGSVYGGRSVSGAVTNNITTITSGEVKTNVYGGYSASAAADGNTVDILGGTVAGNVYAGYSESGAVTGGTVNINGADAHITGTVYGGHGTSVTGTTVNWTSGTIDGDVVADTVNIKATNEVTRSAKQKITATTITVEKGASLTQEGNLDLTNTTKLTAAGTLVVGEDITYNKASGSIVADGGNVTAASTSFVDSNITALSAATNAFATDKDTTLNVVFDAASNTTYSTAQLTALKAAYYPTLGETEQADAKLNLINATLKVDDSKEQIVVKRKDDSTGTEITIETAPQVVDKNNNKKETAVAVVPQSYVAVAQKAEGKSPELQTVTKVTIKSDFASKGLQVVSETGKVEMKIAGSVVMTGGSDASSGIVVDENGKGLTTDIEVGESGYFAVGVEANTADQKGKLGNLTVSGAHALAGNDATKTDYTYEQLAIGAAKATVAVTKAALTVKKLSAGDGSIYVDPAYLAINELANNTLGVNLYVSEGSVTNIAGDATELRAATEAAGFSTTDASTGFTVASDKAVLGIDGNISVTSGKKLIVDSAVDNSGADVNNTTGAQVYFGNNSLLVVNAEKAAAAPVITLDKQTVKVESTAKLYLRNALAKQNYTIVSGASTDENGIIVAGWGNDGGEKTGETTLYANRLLKYTAKVDSGSYVITTLPDLDPSVFQGSFVYPALKEIADNNLLDADSSYGGIKFLSRATDATYIGDAQMTPVMEEMVAIAATSGVQHTALRASDLVVDTIGEHLTAAKAEKGANLWATPLRTSLTTTSRTESTANISGIMVGYDNGNEKGRFGVAIQGGWGTSHSEGTVSYYQNKNKFAGVSLYGSQKIGKFDLKASLGYTKFGNDVRSYLASGLNMGLVNTDIDAKAFTADVRVERTYETKSGLGITPHVGLRYTRLSTDSYDNNIISGDSEKQNIWQLPIGVTFAQTLSKKEGWTLRPYLDLSFVPAFGGKETDSRVRFTGLSSVVSSATRIIDSTSFLGSLGFGAERGKFGMGLSYTLQKGSSEMNSTLALNLNWKF